MLKFFQNQPDQTIWFLDLNKKNYSIKVIIQIHFYKKGIFYL